MRIARTTARVLPVSQDGAVLLLQDQDPARPGVLRWGTIGGAAEPGESLAQAAVRELREETGILAAPELLTAPIGHGTHEFSWGGCDYVSDTTFFAMPLDRGVAVSFDHLEAVEVGNVLAAAWWLPADLEVDGTAVAPDIPGMMRRAAAALSRPGPDLDPTTRGTR